MPEATDEKQRFYQNLVDIGCSWEMIQYCMRLWEECREQELRLVLQRYRKELMDLIHAGQGKVDCLDYLLNRIGKERGNLQHQHSHERK